jgi:predicted DNA-binding protein (MmcQ/YjbR family)
MEVEDLISICNKHKNATSDIKWEHNLTFCIGKKMYLIVSLNESPISASFKVDDQDFYSLSERQNFRPAPYLARYKWIMIEDINCFSKEEWEHYLQKSYQLIYQKLPKKIKENLG